MQTGRFSATVAAALAVTALVTSSCGDPPSAVQPGHAHLAVVTDGAAAASAAGLVKELHAVSARFHSTQQATRAGYVQSSPCVSHPTLGAMGFHWVNQSLVDPVFDPLRPEVLLYSPDAKGRPALAAVEYVVVNVGQPAPTFDGQPFDVGGAPIPVAHWSLHVWVHRTNPSGMFAPFNPDVRCEP